MKEQIVALIQAALDSIVGILNKLRDDVSGVIDSGAGELEALKAENAKLKEDLGVSEAARAKSDDKIVRALAVLNEE